MFDSERSFQEMMKINSSDFTYLQSAKHKITIK